MKYFIITFGCQMNRSDSGRIATVLEKIGYRPASKENEADLILVNMCSVRQSAVDRVYGLMPKFSKLKTKNRKLKTILTGCILKQDRRKFKKGPAPYRTEGSGAGFNLILNIKDLPKLPKLLKVGNYKLKTENYLNIETQCQTSFIGYVPIMTGCNNFCTYCVVPYTRGKEVSRQTEEILHEVKNLIKKGVKEIWLLGQNVNSYRDEKTNFPKLLKMVNNIPGNFWIRFTSSHPKDLSDELIDSMANCEKVTEYLNLPVQSGDNKILKKMNRPYTVKQYGNLVRKIREKIPEIALSTDVIIGFPGETKEQFVNTVKLFKEIKYDMAYIAQYSHRPETAAAKLKDDVLLKEKGRRYKILTEFLRESALERNKKYIGKEIEVLIMKHGICNMKNFYIGKSRTYKTVKIELPVTGNKSTVTNFVGQFVKVKIIDAFPWGLKGILL